MAFQSVLPKLRHKVNATVDPLSTSSVDCQNRLISKFWKIFICGSDHFGRQSTKNFILLKTGLGRSRFFNGFDNNTTAGASVVEDNFQELWQQCYLRRWKLLSQPLKAATATVLQRRRPLSFILSVQIQTLNSLSMLPQPRKPMPPVDWLDIFEKMAAEESYICGCDFGIESSFWMHGLLIFFKKIEFFRNSIKKCCKKTGFLWKQCVSSKTNTISHVVKKESFWCKILC